MHTYSIVYETPRNAMRCGAYAWAPLYVVTINADDLETAKAIVRKEKPMCVIVSASKYEEV